MMFIFIIVALQAKGFAGIVNDVYLIVQPSLALEQAGQPACTASSISVKAVGGK